MSDVLAVAAVQFDVSPEPSWPAFADRARRQLDEAGDADLVVFGECMTIGLSATTPGWAGLAPRQAFEALPEHAAVYEDLFAAEASQRGQTIVAGSTFMRGDDGLLNVAHVFSPDGTVVRHTKSHLFPGEWDWLAGEGDEVTVIEVAGVRCGILVCYEAEVPELATIHGGLGVDVLLTPSYTFTVAGFHRVRQTLAARCIENQMYAVHCPVVGVGSGPVPDGRGHASFLGPCEAGLPDDGVIAAGPPDQPAVVTARFDLDLLRALRRDGAATTVKDRARKRGMYEKYASYLWPQAGDPAV
ncbi:nitrilase-related carbon-nitrogen hydrolase [Gordonia westfalica]|uniref:Predicted amidohydrolase n=1 Tax=Gordonia westfalica TaxID=158898 RepID=A0A1H2LGR7_9ACTN|nr:nitrilase-related carbon-nitrogen hydrolase [Gordonia westfalica]SDU80230.1 Predicted amidohydrolase [Gordonia westfalica]